MITDANKNEMIERYLLGELSGDLLHTFNDKLATDEGFRKEVALERAIIKNLRTAGRNEWALKLKNLHHQMELNDTESSMHDPDITEEEYNKRLGSTENKELPEWNADKKATPGLEAKVVPLNQRRNVWLVAASVALIAVCTLTFTFISNQGTDADSIFQAYYQPYPEPSVFRGATDLTVLEKEAFAAYSQQNYPRSIELFKQVLDAQKNETALFYLGHAYVEAQMYEEAIQTFEQYIQAYQELDIPAKWYLSLSYLKTAKTEQASKYLKEVAATTETDPEAREYATKAREILDKME